ncbi:hypothetical protein [Cryptosporangium sp. NPDC051539]|uniref:hypothetical protein n=1 Tax=Cryptosporangium sp. NPDC051539 TaxID=3363962 RepID=UPI00378E7715
MARGRAEHVLAAVLALLALAPVLRPGYVLAYDMVATPRVPFTAAALGWGDGLPRAVPQDAVVAVLTSVVPGWVVQVVALVAVVWVAVVGAARLVPSDRVAVRLVAGAAYGWNAYVAERLLIGHWGLLLGYAALPWIVRSARAARAGAHPAPVVLWSALAALTPTGGLLAAITAAVVLCRPAAHPPDPADPDAANSDAALTDPADPDAALTGAALTGAALTGAALTGVAVTDADLTDPAPPDAALTDAGQTDAALTDAGQTDAAVTDAGRLRDRARPLWVLAVVALNAPWVVAGAMAKVSAVSDPDGVTAFAARGENWSGTLGALLGLGGIWNAETVPASRTSVAAPLVTLLVLAIAAAGLRPLLARWGRGPVIAASLTAAGGIVIAAAGAFPVTQGLLGALVAHVPGSGLLRDGQKFLAPYALLLAVAFALGADRLAAPVSRLAAHANRPAAPVDRPAAPVNRLAAHANRLVAAALTVAAVAFPVLALPDLAWGGAGRLHSVQYPDDWDRVAAELARDPHGTLAVLPFSTFRAYPWNGDRTALDPAPRYFPVDVVAEDALVVGTATVSGESPRAAAVRDAIARRRSLVTAGIRWILIERTTPGDAPASALAGYDQVWRGPDLVLYRADPAPRVVERAETVRKAAVLAGYALALGVLLGALASWALPRRD